MILELADGREIRLPDRLSDDEARADRLSALEREHDAERSIHDLILAELREIRRVLLADRQMIQDPTTGELTRSRVIIRR
jgi:hypothetical protein